MPEITLEEKRYIQIGLKIAYYRKMKNLSQEELSELIGINPKYLSRIETPSTAQSISLKTLFLIADTLEIAPNKFLEFEGI